MMAARGYSWIDKTAAVEELLQTSAAVCLCGMPGMGKKTLVRMLLQKHSEVNAVILSVKDLMSVSVGERKGKACTWYLVRKFTQDDCLDLEEKLWEFFRTMPREDKVFFAVDGTIPQEILSFVWNGLISPVYPEALWFTEAETYRYLKEKNSILNGEEVWRFTHGWPGCIALLVKVQKQQQERWSLEELCSRYEMHSFIQTRILNILSEEERKMLEKRAPFPRINTELLELLWGEVQSGTEESLLMKGLMVYSSREKSWQVLPVIRRCLHPEVDLELGMKAVRWYEEKGFLYDALECCRNLRSREEYKQCLIRNYDRVAFLNFEGFYDFSESAEQRPELFFLEWMKDFFRQNISAMDRGQKKARSLWRKCSPQDKNKQIWKEVFFNIAYLNPNVTLKKWMEMLEKLVKPGEGIRIYDMQGESVSCLSGLRDLSGLFFENKKNVEYYRKVWKSRLSEENYKGYKLAAVEYAFLIDKIKTVNQEVQDVLEDITDNDPWQLRIGQLYILYLFAEGPEGKIYLQDYINELAEKLQKEESGICQYNAMALYHLAKARWGEKEDIIKWLRNTGGDIANKAGKTFFHLMAQIKIHLYLSDYAQADRILNVLIPYFRRNNIWKYKAETLFQKAMVEKEKGRDGNALRYAAESFQTADPYRYVKIYTGYGKKGLELLELYGKWLREQDQNLTNRKKQYKYGSVLRMPYVDWIDYIIRKAKKNSRNYPEHKIKGREFVQTEKLTTTEHMVLQYLERGYTNAEISTELNVKLATVKTHVYNIYKKLGVSNRVQAVQKGKEEGIL